jgi:hypothetical protein
MVRTKRTEEQRRRDAENLSRIREAADRMLEAQIRAAAEAEQRAAAAVNTSQAAGGGRYAPPKVPKGRQGSGGRGGDSDDVEPEVSDDMDSECSGEGRRTPPKAKKRRSGGGEDAPSKALKKGRGGGKGGSGARIAPPKAPKRGRGSAREPVDEGVEDSEDGEVAVERPDTQVWYMNNTKSKEVRVDRDVRSTTVEPLIRTTMSRDEAAAYMSRGGDITRLDRIVQFDAERHNNMDDQHDWVELLFKRADGEVYDPEDFAKEGEEDA